MIEKKIEKLKSDIQLIKNDKEYIDLNYESYMFINKFILLNRDKQLTNNIITTIRTIVNETREREHLKRNELLNSENKCFYCKKVMGESTLSQEEADKRAMEFYKATRTHGRWGKHIAVYDMEKDRTVSFMCPQCEHKWARTEKDR